MRGKALAGLKILEFAEFAAGPFCGKLFADLGAEVIKIEKPHTGDPARYRGPFYKMIPHHENSGTYLFLNTSKKGITLEPSTSTGRDIFLRLIKDVDILIEDRPPGRMQALGLDYDTLRQLNQRLIMVSITPFGESGPHRDYKAYPLNTFYSSIEPMTIYTGLPDTLERPPLKLPGLVGEHDVGLSAAIGLMAALYRRARVGRGTHIELSKQEALLSKESVYISDYISNGRSEHRHLRHKHGDNPPDIIGGVKRCKDGYVQLTCHSNTEWEALLNVIEHPAWAMKNKYQTIEGRAEAAEFINSALANTFRPLSKSELYRLALKYDCPLAPIRSIDEVLESPQLKERGFFHTLEHPCVGTLSYPSVPYQMSGFPWHGWAAPLLGEHNYEIYCKWLGFTPEDLVSWSQAGII